MTGGIVDKKCGHCPGSVHITESEIEEQAKRVLDSGVPIAEEDIYEARLLVCGRCEQLIYGTTCMSCGCLVKVRALNALRICPHPAGNKW
jgi:hypothetical protein